MPYATRGEVDVTVEAPPEKVYALVSDVTRMGEWSPETVRCEWADGATGPAVGARFKAQNRRGWMRWSNKPEVVAAEPGKEFAFSRKAPGSAVVWRYTLSPEGTGTKLTESYEVTKQAPAAMNWLAMKLLGSKDREADLAENMRTTLARIKAAAESA